MSGFIAKQPNGKFCRFSSTLDCPVAINMTAEDYVAYCAERAVTRAIADAYDVLNRYVQPFEEIENRFYPHNMTEDEFKQVLEKMKNPDGRFEEL